MGSRILECLLDMVEQPVYIPSGSYADGAIQEVKRQNSVAESPLTAPQTSDQAVMLEACKTGQLLVLQTVFQAHEVYVDSPNKETSPWLSKCFSEGGPYPLSSLINVSILHRQYAIVSYLLNIHVHIQGWNLWDERIMYALLKTRDLRMLDLLHSFAPDICAWEFNYTVTFLTEACLRGPEIEPLICYLLDHGADIGVGFPIDMPLDRATRYGLSLDTIRKMVNSSSEFGAAYACRALNTAIRAQRWDALVYFLKLWRCRDRRHLCKHTTEAARETKNEMIIALVESRPCGCGERSWMRRQRAVLRLVWMGVRATATRVSTEKGQRDEKKQLSGASESETNLVQAKLKEKEKLLEVYGEEDDD